MASALALATPNRLFTSTRRSIPNLLKAVFMSGETVTRRQVIGSKNAEEALSAQSEQRDKKPEPLQTTGKLCALPNESLDDIDRRSRLPSETAKLLDGGHQRIDFHRPVEF